MTIGAVLRKQNWCVGAVEHGVRPVERAGKVGSSAL
jgi:hypothetical protein